MQSSAAEHRNVPIQVQPPAERLSVWVVDDDPMALTAARLVLEQQEHQAKVYNDPRRLIAALAQPERPQLILADLYMPEMSGIELIQRVRGVYPEIPVTIMTSSRELDGTVQAINQGAFGYLLKPVVPEQLGWLIGRLQRERALKKDIEAEHVRLAHAQRLAKLGTLTSGIAHEINNPNCFVLGNIDVLQKLWARLEPELDKLEDRPGTTVEFARREMPGILRELRSGANRIANIVRSLTAYSRREPGALSRASVVKAVEDAAMVLRNKLSVLKFALVDECGGAAIAAVNATDLEQMMVNLISNAADATEGVADPSVSVFIRRPQDGKLRVDVADNGQGIAWDQMDLLETPFFTTKQPGAGTGLGLYITRQLVSRAGGALSYGNNPLAGAIFSLVLPVAFDPLDLGEPHEFVPENPGR